MWMRRFPYQAAGQDIASRCQLIDVGSWRRNNVNLRGMRRKKDWRRTARAPSDEAEKAAIIAACEAFIRDVLKPRFLPAIRPTEWNYVVDIRGAWAGGRYRFMQRYRSGMEDNRGEEFDAP